MNLFKRVRKLTRGIGPPEPPEPQFYRVACVEGHVLRGQRTEGYQALRCPGCGDGLFVLPLSPLPMPRPPATRARQAPPTEEADDAPIAWSEAPASALEAGNKSAAGESDESAAGFENTDSFYEDVVLGDAPATPQEEGTATPASESPTGPERPARTRRRPASTGTSARRSGQFQQQVPVPPRVAWHRRNRPLLIVAAVMALVALTVTMQLRRQHKARLPGLAAASQQEGLAALADGRFDVARKRLDEAARALEELRDLKATEVRQIASEAAIFADLINLPLEELVEKAATDPGGWEKLRDVHRGRSILVDSQVEPSSVTDAAPRIEYRILTPGRTGELDLEGLDLFKRSPPRPGDTVTFGARIDEITLGADNVWRVRLIPDSGVLLVSPEAWRATEVVGWPARDQKLEDLP